MHKFASFNHKILPADNININAISSASLYGKGIFTTFSIHNSKPFLWKKHWRRLNENAETLNINLSHFSEKKVYESLERIIKKNNLRNARCRITFFDESLSKIWQTSNENQTSLLIQTADLRESKENISLTISPFPINSKSPITGVKSCNYLENLLAFENAGSNGFDEAIRLNERGEITSACMANIFWLKGETLFTPSLKTGCLAGTTREYIMEKQNVFEVEESLEVLDKAEIIFLSSSGIGITQIGKFQAKEFVRVLSPAFRQFFIHNQEAA
ncbi:MAG: aminotransferase class IV [Aridibacter sp.]